MTPLPEGPKVGYVCLKPKKFSYLKPRSCENYIKGSCKTHLEFKAGIERFYVPKEEAKALEKLLEKPKTKAQIVLSVTRDGKAQVKDLLINGKSWKISNK